MAKIPRAAKAKGMNDLNYDIFVAIRFWLLASFKKKLDIDGEYVI
jgi:hypothetical protein